MLPPSDVVSLETFQNPERSSTPTKETWARRFGLLRNNLPDKVYGRNSWSALIMPIYYCQIEDKNLIVISPLLSEAKMDGIALLLRVQPQGGTVISPFISKEKTCDAMAAVFPTALVREV